ncbi:hypothetical protein LPC08_04080 [Roseomonas sp. OT10]|uniref:hypothetical protein n=1 Tax=Roseomonas cutis TaxID=2897332 RepID=UPI001E4EA336|nr:hypothetical protein [Roseomonas sp. OT10]UFN49832.1 hypothetical protein LPC08_04080 [Roseomonas sp. OT10]
MDGETIILLGVGMFVAVFLLSGGLALWLMRRLRRASDQPLSHGPDGSVVIPVRGLSRRFSAFAYSRNSISPRFAIGRDGVRFKVFRPDHWPFSAIERVDAPWTPFGTRIALKARGRGTLFVDVAGEAKGRELLRALPAGLAFTPRASGMRDGVA